MRLREFYAVVNTYVVSFSLKIAGRLFDAETTALPKPKPITGSLLMAGSKLRPIKIHGAKIEPVRCAGF